MTKVLDIQIDDTCFIWAIDVGHYFSFNWLIHVFLHRQIIGIHFHIRFCWYFPILQVLYVLSITMVYTTDSYRSLWWFHLILRGWDQPPSFWHCQGGFLLDQMMGDKSDNIWRIFHYYKALEVGSVKVCGWISWVSLCYLWLPFKIIY